MEHLYFEGPAFLELMYCSLWVLPIAIILVYNAVTELVKHFSKPVKRSKQKHNGNT